MVMMTMLADLQFHLCYRQRRLLQQNHNPCHFCCFVIIITNDHHVVAPIQQFSTLYIAFLAEGDSNVKKRFRWWDHTIRVEQGHHGNG